MGIFPNEAGVLRLAGSILLEVHDEWQIAERRYLSEASMAKLYESDNDGAETKAGIRALVAFVEANQPQLATYGFYLDEGKNHMTVVSVHPDSASLERHIEIGGPEFRKLAPFLALREIEVFGRLSERAVELVREKAATLGDQGVVRVHEQFAGFDRVKVPSDQ